MSLQALQKNVIRITGRFKKLGAYADPTTVTLRLKRPDGTAHPSPPAMVQLRTGIWYADFDTQAQPAGTWTYGVEGDGLVDANNEGEFTVIASAF